MSKIIAQIVLAGVTVFGKAFMQAYSQAVANGGKRAGEAAAKQGSAALSDLTRSSGISAEEAAMILNVDLKKLFQEQDPLQKIKLRSDHLFKVNDKQSFYLQSKVVRSKERLEQELQQQKQQEQK